MASPKIGFMYPRLVSFFFGSPIFDVLVLTTDWNGAWNEKLPGSRCNAQSRNRQKEFTILLGVMQQNAMCSKCCFLNFLEFVTCSDPNPKELFRDFHGSSAVPWQLIFFPEALGYNCHSGEEQPGLLSLGDGRWLPCLIFLQILTCPAVSFDKESRR